MSKKTASPEVSLLYNFNYNNTKHKGLFVVVIIWSLVILLGLFYMCLIGIYFKGDADPHDLKVMSYNIWNYHSYWNTRKWGVAEVIREAYPDVVLLQEVRSSHHNKQLDDLKALLPYLRYSAFAVATPNADFDSAEGLGILSRYPILDTSHYNFTMVPTDGDRNTRTCLSATINMPRIGKLQVYVTHLSYEKTTQCRQITELISFIGQDPIDEDCSKNIQKIVAGDFNIYADFEGPSDILTKPLLPSNPCYSYIDHGVQNDEDHPQFIDVWRMLHPHDSGLTFSLMPFKDAEHLVPSTGLESRPDRIYLNTASCALRATSIHKTAGEVYGTSFHTRILYEQLFAYLSITGWPYAIFGSPLLFTMFALFRVPKIYIYFAISSAVYVYMHVKDFPSNPDDFHPSDHLALVSTFALR